jgi:excinuclease ABC subunit C
LIIIDGGRGHLNTVKKILEKLKINDLDIIAISKGVNRNKGDESIHTNEKSIKFDKRSENLFFLQRLRDEAHRFAISSTKLRHTKSLKTSVFDKIEGLGTKTKSNLLSYFGSIDNIKTASIGDLKKVPNIGTKMARKLYYEFNRNV